MNVLLIFFFLLAIFIGIIALGIYYFKWLLKTRQKKNESSKTGSSDIK